jgi:hypothetical protein
MRELLPASRVQPLVMHASKRRHEHPEFHAVAFRRYNAGDNPRASTSFMRELLPASRVQPLVMTAPERQHETR